MKKLFSILLVLLMLCSCTGPSNNNQNNQNNQNDDYDVNEYIELLENFKSREKNINNTVNNEEFEKFLNDMFIEEIAQDYINLHYTIINYEDYGIEKPEVNLGEVTYGFDEEQVNYYVDVLDKLKEFDYDSLSYRQQYDYEVIEYSIYETLSLLSFYQYDFYFSKSVDILTSIVSTLNDFTFYNKENVDDYLILVADIDRYLDDVLKYTDDQKADGIYMNEVIIDNGLESANNFVSKVEDNALITVFNNRINNLDFLSEDEKTHYINENKEIVINEVIPSYQKVIDYLNDYDGVIDIMDSRLCVIDKNYAKAKFMVETSSNDSIDEIFELLNDTYDMLNAKLNTAFYDEQACLKAYDILNNGYLDVDADYMINNLSEIIKEIYPLLPETKFNCEYLDASAAGSSYVAYYRSSPIDDLNQNVIRINPNSNSYGVDLYSTLAHEGFPGHLYQFIFYKNTDYSLIRELFSFTGYTEGWAVDAQMNAIELLTKESEEVNDIINILNSYYFFEYGIIDMGINYYGWENKDVVEFLSSSNMEALINYLYYYDAYVEAGISLNDLNEYLISDYYEGYADSLISWLIDMPGTYCNYSVGYAYINKYKDMAKQELGDKFNITDFYYAILKNGPVSFDMLEEAVNEYIEAN